MCLPFSKDIEPLVVYHPQQVRHGINPPGVIKADSPSSHGIPVKVGEEYLQIYCNTLEEY